MMTEAPDPHLARSRIGEEVDLLDRLLELVECVETAREQRTAVDGRLDPALASIKQSDPECIFEVGDGLRYGRLGHRELRGRLSHAAAAGHRHEDVQIPKIEVAAEPPLVPFRRGRHSCEPSSIIVMLSCDNTIIQL